MVRKYRIHPAIGIARIGDSPDDYFVGPEAPGVPPSLNKPDSSISAPGKYKDQQHRIKRQGARFRIYEFSYDNDHNLAEVREITAAHAHIQWSVALANRKAAAPNFLQTGRRNPGVPVSQLVIDAGQQAISGISQPMERLAGTFKGISVPLGDLLTDSAGRLIVLGGFGRSRSVPLGQPILTFANNDGWCDDVSDGPIKATIRFHDTHIVKHPEPAWVIVAPPDFAPPIENIITLYDVVLNAMAKIHRSLAIHRKTHVSFTRDIYPILRRAVGYQWVSNLGRRGHGPGTEADFLEPKQLAMLSDKAQGEPEDDGEHEHGDPHAAAMDHDHHHPEPTNAAEMRHHTFEHLRVPGGGGGGDMPMLNTLEASDPVALTEYQYELMKRWAAGNFDADWTGQGPVALPFDQLPVRDQPEALDKAALEACVGGGFFPGIEVGRIMRATSTYSRTRPFRISNRLRPGTLTANMAVPWQADFRDCGSGWWPAQRPNQIIRAGPEPVLWIPNSWNRATMVARWSELGFIVKQAAGSQESFVEDERNF
jgi:hypothetical protein